MLDVPGLPACSASRCGFGCQSPWPWTDPLDCSMRTHAQQEQRFLNLHSSEGCGPRIYPFGQCRCMLTHSAHEILCTYPYLWFAGTGSLECIGPAAGLWRDGRWPEWQTYLCMNPLGYPFQQPWSIFFKHECLQNFCICACVFVCSWHMYIQFYWTTPMWA